MEKYNVGILGAGFMGKTHAGSLSKLDNVKVTAVCDISENLIADLNEATGCSATAYTNFDNMLANENLDILYVCLPPFAHNGEVEKAAAKGIHLFLEKPIAIDSEKAEKMVAAIEANGVKSQVGFHMRFRKSIQKLKKMIDDGSAGKATLFAGRYWTNMDGSEWWRDQSKSGGQIFEQIIHIYDLATYLFGETTNVSGIVSNICHNGRKDYSIEDTSVGVLNFANGAAGVVTGSNCAVPMHFFGDFRVVCENVSLDYSCTGQTWVDPDKSILYYGEDKRDDFVEDSDPYLLETQDFINAICEDRNTCTPARDGLNAIKLVEAIRK